MKKRIKVVLEIAILILMMTGCGNNSLDLNKTTTITFKDLKVEIPTQFKKDEENSDDIIIQFYFDTDDNKNTCMMNFSKFEGYPSSNLKETIYQGLLMRNNIEYSSKTINGITWSTGYYIEDIKQIEHFYAVNYNNTLYEFGFEDFGSGDLCNQAFEKIANSLRLN